jgi:hypothetical protein
MDKLGEVDLALAVAEADDGETHANTVAVEPTDVRTFKLLARKKERLHCQTDKKLGPE